MLPVSSGINISWLAQKNFSLKGSYRLFSHGKELENPLKEYSQWQNINGLGWSLEQLQSVTGQFKFEIISFLLNQNIYWLKWGKSEKEWVAKRNNSVLL